MVDIDISCLKTGRPEPDPDWEPSERNSSLSLLKIEQRRARVNETFLRLDRESSRTDEINTRLFEGNLWQRWKDDYLKSNARVMIW